MHKCNCKSKFLKTQKGVIFLPESGFVVSWVDLICVMMGLRLLRLRLTGKSMWGFSESVDVVLFYRNEVGFKIRWVTIVGRATKTNEIHRKVNLTFRSLKRLICRIKTPTCHLRVFFLWFHNILIITDLYILKYIKKIFKILELHQPLKLIIDRYGNPLLSTPPLICIFF